MPDTAGLAIDLAMEEARGNPALQGHVAAFLSDQRGLIADQRHHMRIQLRQLHLGIAEKWLGVLLRVAAAFTGLAVAAGLAYLIWNAAASNQLVVDAFTVPPDLAAKGASGEVVAGQFLDALSDMQQKTSAVRPPSNLTNSYSGGIKLEIPETGVSLSELDRFLRDKLGHDIHVSGAVIRTSTGLTMTVRVDGSGSESVDGSDTDIAGLMRRGAESVYKITQPLRYNIYLGENGRTDEALVLMRRIISTGSNQDRSYTLNSMAFLLSERADVHERLALLERAAVLAPENPPPSGNKAVLEDAMGRTEAALHDSGKALTITERAIGRGETTYVVIRKWTQAKLASFLGDYQEAAARQAETIGARRGILGLTPLLASFQTGAHDLAAARTTLDNASEEQLGFEDTVTAQHIVARMGIARAMGDWQGVLAQGRLLQPLAKHPGLRSVAPSTSDLHLAYAQAQLGNFAQAETVIAPTSADCYACLRTRALIAELEGQHARADYWFARAVAEGPSIPFAHEQWGRALLARGKPDEAIEKFKLSSKKGPHFADPLEGWGEALMAKNQSHLALAKFAEAEKYAPNWGRLHLKWGEALYYAGKRDEAKAQFARAAQLDLTPSEKSELVRHS